MFHAPYGANMDFDSEHSLKASEGPSQTIFTSLDRETRVAVDTETAAHHLIRKPQTLRIWACRENGPLRPIRLHGRLMWSVAEIKKLVGA